MYTIPLREYALLMLPSYMRQSDFFLPFLSRFYSQYHYCELIISSRISLLRLYHISISIGYYWEQGDTSAYNNYAWQGFAVLFIVNVLEAVYIAARRDIVWTAAATWIAISIWRAAPKSAPVSVSFHAFSQTCSAYDQH